MAKFTKIRGSDRVIAKITGIVGLTRKGMRQGMFQSGRGLISRANTEILRKPKSGRTYIIRDRSGRRRRHVASAPGETHANLSGDTRKSMGYQLHGTSELEFGYGVSSGKKAPDYAGFLENTRPSLQNAIRSEQGNMVRHFENGIEDALK